MTAAQTIYRRLRDKRRPVSVVINRDFDTRWIGELPIAFDGTPEECADYAESKGCRWIPDDSALMGGRWEHPDEPLILYPL